MASRIMPPTIYDQQEDLGRIILPVVLLSAIATLATIVSVAMFFWPDNIDRQISVALQNIRGSRQQTTSRTETINDRPAAENFLTQTPGTDAINNNLASVDQFIALSVRLNTLQDAMTRIQRDNADLAQQLRATQTQMAQDNALVAEQLKAVTQMMARRAGVLAMGSDEGERRSRTIKRKAMPEISRAEVSGALAARRPAGALLGKFPSNSQ